MRREEESAPATMASMYVLLLHVYVIKFNCTLRDKSKRQNGALNREMQMLSQAAFLKAILWQALLRQTKALKLARIDSLWCLMDDGMDEIDRRLLLLSPQEESEFGFVD